MRMTFDLWRRWSKDIVAGTTAYSLTTLAVGLGLLFSSRFVKQNSQGSQPSKEITLLASCVRFDGGHYRDIVQHGYDYDSSKRSNVAFFPAYPLITWLLVVATGLSVEAALLIVSNAFLIMAFILLAAYSRQQQVVGSNDRTAWILLAFGLWPSTLFFRMAYAESMFLCVSIVFLIGATKRWPLIVLALIAGLASATRPVGVAVTAAFFWYGASRAEVGRFVRWRQVVLLAPVASWGISAYMVYQYVVFGNPFAFAQTQEHWTNRAPYFQSEFVDKLCALLTLEPIWNAYDPYSPFAWFRLGGDSNFVFNLFFWNPLLFVISAVLVAWGTSHRILNGPESVLGILLLAIPYLTRSYEMSMASHARFAAAVVVAYPVMGRLLANLPAPTASIVLSLCAMLLTCWSALYTAGYLFF